MAEKLRSHFWVVTTHVLTTGIVMPLVANLAAGVLSGSLNLAGWSAFGMRLILLAVGYVAGTYYSLSYLKKQTTVPKWSDCTVPAVITFAGMAVLGLAYDVYLIAHRRTAPVAHASAVVPEAAVIACLAVFYLVIVLVFALITRQTFRDNDLESSVAEEPSQ